MKRPEPTMSVFSPTPIDPVQDGTLLSQIAVNRSLDCRPQRPPDGNNEAAPV